MHAISIIIIIISMGQKCGKARSVFDCIEQAQLRAYRLFLGVGRLHPKTSLQIETGLLPLKWEAKKRCIEFWHKVMTKGEERLVKRV